MVSEASCQLLHFNHDAKRQRCLRHAHTQSRWRCLQMLAPVNVQQPLLDNQEPPNQAFSCSICTNHALTFTSQIHHAVTMAPLFSVNRNGHLSQHAYDYTCITNYPRKFSWRFSDTIELVHIIYSCCVFRVWNAHIHNRTRQTPKEPVGRVRAQMALRTWMWNPRLPFRSCCGYVTEQHRLAARYTHTHTHMSSHLSAVQKIHTWTVSEAAQWDEYSVGRSVRIA
jgi:hypothetical protein